MTDRSLCRSLPALLAIVCLTGCSSSDHDDTHGGDASTAMMDATVGDASSDGSLLGDGGGVGPGSDGGDSGVPPVCAPATPVGDGGFVIPDAGDGVTCSTAGDCAATQGCVNGMCGGCAQTSDCGATETCNAGKCSSTCDPTTTLQSIVDAAGAIVTVPACVFREMVTISKPITLIARPGAEIRGSDVWTKWTATKTGGTVYTSAPSLAAPTTAYDACHCGVCGGADECSDKKTCVPPMPCACAATAVCELPQQVFLDGAPLTQVPSGTPAIGEFAVDLTTGAITLATDADLTKSTVEVTMRATWMRSSLSASASLQNVTVQGFTMRHAASPPQRGAFDTTGGKCGTMGGWTVKNNRFLHAAGGVLTVNAYDQILGNEIGYGGQEGVNSTCFSHGLMQGNYIHDNNTEDFDSAWEAAGVKGTQTVGAVYDGNIVTNNMHGAPGLWADINTYDTTYTNNYLASNSGSGIFYEISNKALMACNVAVDNGPSASCCGNDCPAGTGCGFGGGAQIVVSASANVTIAKNTVSGGLGIGVYQQYREDSCDGGPPGDDTVCSPGVCSGADYGYHRVSNIVIADNDVTVEQPMEKAHAIATGMNQDICTLAGICAANSPGGDAGDTCDASAFYDDSVLQFTGNTYHAPSCADAGDWYWKDNALIAFPAWTAEAGAEPAGEEESCVGE